MGEPQNARPLTKITNWGDWKRPTLCCLILGWICSNYVVLICINYLWLLQLITNHERTNYCQLPSATYISYHQLPLPPILHLRTSLVPSVVPTVPPQESVRVGWSTTMILVTNQWIQYDSMNVSWRNLKNPGLSPFWLIAILPYSLCFWIMMDGYNWWHGNLCLANRNDSIWIILLPNQLVCCPTRVISNGSANQKSINTYGRPTIVFHIVSIGFRPDSHLDWLGGWQPRPLKALHRSPKGDCGYQAARNLAASLLIFNDIYIYIYINMILLPDIWGYKPIICLSFYNPGLWNFRWSLEFAVLNEETMAVIRFHAAAIREWSKQDQDRCQVCSKDRHLY